MKADNGSASVYIICLPEVPCYNFGNQVNQTAKTSVRDGAIEALGFRENDNLPRVHPLMGKTPPFYNIQYQVVTDWNTYRYVVQNLDNIIIINTHGEILPIPSTYSQVSWMAVIADAVLNRSVTWVHTGSYPFFQMWYQGNSTYELWGTFGFQNFTHYLGLDGVTCWPPPYPHDETDMIRMNTYATDTLQGGGWQNLGGAYRAELGRPLNSSQLKNYTVTAIWGSESDYMTGAIVSFVQPSRRFTPSQHKGFGAYVHIGTRNTDDGQHSTNSDFYRGYVGAVAAISVVVQKFETKEYFTSWSPDVPAHSYTEVCVMVTPVISGWNFHDDANVSNKYWDVDVNYGIYCCMKTNATSYFDSVSFDVSSDYADGVAIVEECSVNAHRNDADHTLQIAGGIVSSVLGIVAFLAPSPEPGSKLWGIMQILGGIMLFSDISDLTGNVYPDNSGDPKTREAWVVYTPSVFQEDKSGFTFKEFESSIRVRAKIGVANFKPWSVAPLNVGLDVNCMDYSQKTVLSAYYDSDICYNNYNDQVFPFNTTIFFDDFGQNLDGWISGDLNPGSGQDTWGLYTGNNGTGEPCVWCAEVGNNSLHGDVPNVNAKPDWPYFGLYDKEMEATLSLNGLDLSPYTRVWIRYKTCYFLGSGDYLAVEYTDPNWNNLLSNYTASVGQDAPTLNIPRTCRAIRFRFHSNSDSNVDWGAFVYYVELIGELPNDANTDCDAGEIPGTALQINTGVPYTGYLDDDRDVYNFTVTGSDITNRKTITVSVFSPYSLPFLVSFANPAGQTVAGPSTLALTYGLVPGRDSPGNWVLLLLNTTMVFGPYSFRVDVGSPPGGGCPFVSVWKGGEFTLDNNILPLSETSGGVDVEDYYVLREQPTSILERSATSFYSLRIGEFEREHSFIDQVRLFAVDHASNLNIALTSSGEVLTYLNPTPPLSCVDDHGIDRLGEVGTMDGDLYNSSTYFEGRRGDSLVLNFGRVSPSSAKLILRDDQKCQEDTCIEIQIPSQSEGWRTIEVLHPRDLWAVEAVNLTAWLPMNEDFLVRLFWTASHRLDFVGLDTASEGSYSIKSGTVVLAVHSADGNVLPELNLADGKYAELAPNQQIWLVCSLPTKNPGETRTFVFYSKGHYYTVA